MRRKKAGLIMLITTCMVFFCAMRAPVLFEQEFQNSGPEQTFSDDKYVIQVAYLASGLNTGCARDIVARRITSPAHTRQSVVFQPFFKLEELAESFSGRLAILLLVCQSFLCYVMCQLQALQRIDGKKRKLLL